MLQESRFYTLRTARSYELLARRGAQVLLLAHGWSEPAEPVPGLHLVGIAADDPLRHEWDLVVCGPRRRFGFVAREEADQSVADMDRRFSWLTTHDPQSLGLAAEQLLARAPWWDGAVPPLARPEGAAVPVRPSRRCGHRAR